MTTITQAHARLFVAASASIAWSMACSGDNSTLPIAPSAATAVSPQPIPPTFPPGAAPIVGAWTGTSTVESTRGILPACVAPFWRPGSTDPVSAEIRPFQDGSRFDMVLHQRASEECHVQLTESQGQIAGSPWPYDEFDCAVVPSLCGLGCHFRLKSTEWNCGGAAPEVWILGVSVSGTVSDPSADRMQGTMEIGYDQRPGGYPTVGGGWSGVTIITRFDLQKVAR